jgi:hypothetical protein
LSPHYSEGGGKSEGGQIFIIDRGANENSNGLLRQYFPKGTDFKKLTEKDVEEAVKKLNNRPESASTTGLPMKCSGKELVVHLQFESTSYNRIGLEDVLGKTF